MANRGTPTVSILMSVHDGRFLAQAVRSLLAQEWPSFELVVVDDGSDGDTRDLLERLDEQDDRMVILRNEARLGLPAALNRGLALCRAPLVARADADDVYRPDRLRRQVAVFDKRPRLAALSCGYRRIDAEGRVLFVRRPVNGPERIRFRAMFENSLLHPGTMFRAEWVRRVGGYDQQFWTAQDSDLWGRLMHIGELDNLAEPLVDWRKHKCSTLGARGCAGKKLSLEVPVRLQATYLDSEPDYKRGPAAVGTWRSHTKQPLATVLTGERQLRRIFAHAKQREIPEVLKDFRSTTAFALRRQARWHSGQNPVAALGMLARAVQWRCLDPSAAQHFDPRDCRVD